MKVQAVKRIERALQQSHRRAEAEFLIKRLPETNSGNFDKMVEEAMENDK